MTSTTVTLTRSTVELVLSALAGAADSADAVNDPTLAAVLDGIATRVRDDVYASTIVDRFAHPRYPYPGWPLSCQDCTAGAVTSNRHPND